MNTALLKYKTKRLDSPQFVRNRILRKISEARIYFTAKWFFHFISIFSTTMMLAGSLTDWLKAPLYNIGIDITRFGDTILLPTVITSIVLSLVLEYASVKTLSKLIEAYRDKEDFGTITIRALAMMILTAVQLYTFVGGVKNTIKFALTPSYYQNNIEYLKNRIEWLDSDIMAITKKIEGVKSGKSEIDDIYSGENSKFLKEFEREFTEAKRKHLAYANAEKKKRVNLNRDGTLKRVARALIADHYNRTVKPFEDRYNRAKSAKVNSKKNWIVNAETDLKRQETKKREYEAKLKKVEEEYQSRLSKIERLTPEAYYWFAGILLMIGLSSMDYLHQKAYSDALERYDNAVKRNEAKLRLSTFNPDEFQLPEPEASRVEETKDKSGLDSDILNYIASQYNLFGRVPSTKQIAEDNNKSTRDISDFFKRNEKYFIREQGKETIATELFKKSYGIEKSLERVA